MMYFIEDDNGDYQSISFLPDKLPHYEPRTMNGGQHLQRFMQLLWMIPDEIAEQNIREFQSCNNCVALEYFIRKHCNIDPVRGIDFNNGGTPQSILGRAKDILF